MLTIALLRLLGVGSGFESQPTQILNLPRKPLGTVLETVTQPTHKLFARSVT